MKTTFKISTLLLALITFACNPAKDSNETDEANDSSAQAETSHDQAINSATDNDFSSINDEQATQLLNAYLDLKNALVASDMDMAESAAEEIKKAVENHTDSQKLEGILEDANHISDTDELEHMREHFDLLSQNIYDMVKVKNVGKTLYKEFCPMAFDNKGAFWLSSEETIKNPYFGDKMLTCGNVQETIASNGGH